MTTTTVAEMIKHGIKLSKAGSESIYLIDGTALHIIKAPAPKYGHPQCWDVVELHRPDLALVTGTSLADACWRLSILRDRLKGGA